LPEISLTDARGESSALTPGETLLAVFKTTCPTCEFAWPYLERIGDLGRGGRLAVLAVSQDDPETTEAFYSRLGISLPTAYDPEPWPASMALGLTAVPTFLLVGSDRTLRDAAVGFQKNKMEAFAAEAARLAGRPVSSLFSPGEQVPAIKPG
jgi:hypothetical protein